MSEKRKALEVARDWARDQADRVYAKLGADLNAAGLAAPANGAHGIADRLRLLADAVDRLAKLEDAALALRAADCNLSIDSAWDALMAMLPPEGS